LDDVYDQSLQLSHHNYTVMRNCPPLSRTAIPVLGAKEINCNQYRRLLNRRLLNRRRSPVQRHLRRERYDLSQAQVRRGGGIISFSERIVSGRNNVGSTRVVGVTAKNGLPLGRGGGFCVQLYPQLRLLVLV
jgi:hypothetical protein